MHVDPPPLPADARTCSMLPGLDCTESRAFHSAHCQRRPILQPPLFSFLRSLTTWHYPHSLDAGCAAVRRAAIDRLAGPTAANLQQLVCCCGPMLGHSDGRTDGRTLDRCIDPPPHSTRTVPITAMTTTTMMMMMMIRK